MPLPFPSLPSPSSPSAPVPRAAFPPPLRLPLPLGTDAPATCEVPPFPPVRVRGGRYRMQRLVRHRGRAVAAGLAVTAAALVAAGPGTSAQAHRAEAAPRPARSARGHPPATPPGPPRPVGLVAAPVRIADAAAVRLLRPGDRVDVVAAQDPSAGGGVRVLARGVRVTRVPEPADAGAESGALVVLAVPRALAPGLVGASATARLAVTLC
ncbi:hypothetical protein [Streptomyces sp. AM6-12]|uniref:hypothetical protein n=1 Tax=Streptomyces sp. AM6-12 TaxID=3345149 RepID=UPI0037BC23D1